MNTYYNVFFRHSLSYKNIYYQYHKNHFHDNMKGNLYKMVMQVSVDTTGIKSCNINTLPSVFKGFICYENKVIFSKLWIHSNWHIYNWKSFFFSQIEYCLQNQRNHFLWRHENIFINGIRDYVVVNNPLVQLRNEFCWV